MSGNKRITRVATIQERDLMDFHANLNNGVEKLQARGYEVEIQFSTAVDEFSIPYYVAILIGRGNR